MSAASVTMLAERVAPDAGLDAATLDRLVFEQGFPITDEGRTTFAYRGDADEVHLLHFGVGLPDDLSFERLPDSDWWLLALSLPEGSRIEYKLHITQGENRWDQDDPLNPVVWRNPFGNNSVCRSHGYEFPAWAEHRPDTPAGHRRSLTLPSGHLGRAVPVTLYLPAAFSMRPERPYPLVVLHDGTDYLHYAVATTVLDNLVHWGLAPEMVVAFCDPGERLSEYANDQRHAAFLVDELVPYLEGHLPLIGDPTHRCLGGASFGAVATLSTANRHPGYFGHLLLQSGSFDGAASEHTFRTDDLWRPVNEFVRGFVGDPRRVADRIFLSCGVFEALIDENRAIAPVLRDTGAEVRLDEMYDGHTWGCWRDSLGAALPWLFADWIDGGGDPEGAGHG